jgi:hypothetical protein
LETYPIITPTNNALDSIDGIVYELTQKDLELADTYEGKYHRRIEVLQSKERFGCIAPQLKKNTKKSPNTIEQ